MDQFETVTLRDPSSPLTATYVPGAGMVATSLSDDGVELLGQRRGLYAYVSNHKTMGIPILYPWANRLSSNGYGVDGAVVTLTPGTGGVRTDEHGVPIHGILAAYPDWTVTTLLESQLTAELDFAARPGLLASYPFPHLLTLDVTLLDRTLTVTTTVTATTGARVPMCFGFHPYLQLPDVPRAQWTLETPAMRYRPVNAWGIPTGVGEQRPAGSEVLGDKVIDDGYDEVAPGSRFALSGGDRRIEVYFDEGFTAAQVFAPGNDDVVCFEPMAAPTDALRRGGYHEVHPGESAVSRFRIKVA
ncbi:aldose 1-epimerase [Mycolicibacterium vaccae]|uniref:Aldose 1-epimerase n=1 Tax=Mycolicibacterium vaccae ATCC 25954 TaxID=1194972 RepID=K0UWQ3_MYCVA|nr:aldose 1-epimerase [Mycolicibacterium vaccae]ANI37745.1 aldose 1-epimerase [Mycolicibacterium vaccae 95051]EJZ09430.1 aldose 1-epimerase [Mycolicibacterium vaccae ATCC 25954]MCV7060761.1 aldose 1-epimerase [Mycolicibacterium vaccae]